MNNRILTGITIGVFAGLIDIIPMIIQKLTWDANFSAFLLWVVVGFMLATSNLKLSGVLKGIVIGLICLLPSIFMIGWSNPLNLIPVLLMTLILGACVGFTFQLIIKE